MQNTTAEIRSWTPKAVSDFETEIEESAAIKMTLQPASERQGGQQLGSNPARKLYARTRRQMGETFAAELDRFSSSVDCQTKKPPRLERHWRVMAVYAIRRQVERGLRRSFFKRF